MIKRRKYSSPKIKSSKVSPITFYGRSEATTILDSEYLLAGPRPS